MLPGVGHFAATSVPRTTRTHATPSRSESPQGVPFLGICVGLQWLFHGSTEAPEQPGLGSLRRYLRSLSDQAGKFRTWAGIRSTVRDESRLLRGVPAGSFVYFTHSYRAPVIH